MAKEKLVVFSVIFHRYLPFLALILANVIWGGNFVVAKVTLQEFPPNSLGLARFALASLLLTPFFIFETKKFNIKSEDLPKLVGVGITIITLNIAFFFAGIQKTTAINASLLTMTIPIMSVLLGWIFLKETVYLINLAGILLGLAGALAILGLPQLFTGTFSITTFVGNIFIILASISFVVGAVLSRPLLQKYPSLIVTGFAFLIGTLTFILPATNEYIQNPEWINHISLLGVLGLIYMTLLSSISAYFLFEWGLAKTSVIKADLFQYVEPIVAAGLAVTLLGERVSTTVIVGTVLIIIGVYLGTFAKEAHHKSQRYHRV